MLAGRRSWLEKGKNQTHLQEEDLGGTGLFSLSSVPGEAVEKILLAAIQSV